ncbi:DNA polymerase epsilon subunit 2 [Thrips palmi]|uniref:DNA polymerase epsilon subunit n=1 Tax=Thrips palmi TaxID=161013 RepID=A0A6P8ZLG2_THRPL|nr:DNA polymerase epsilon subunit 2 [Thrips palmi]
MADLKLRRLVSSAFKLSGFTLRSEACSFLMVQLEPLSDGERKEWLDNLTDNIQRQPLNSATIEKEQVERAIQECCRSGADDSEPILSVISAFETPRFTYNVDRKKFTLITGQPPEILGCAADKARLFRNRFQIIHQRTARHPLFAPSLSETLGDLDENGEPRVKKYKLSPVEKLLCTSSRIANAVVLGMLTQLKEGKFYIEDPTGAVQLDLSNASYHRGLHTDNGIVLVEGSYEDRILYVDGIGQPPAELSKTSRAYFGNINTFGGPSETCLKNSAKLLKIEKSNEDGMIIFIADVWLDHLKVMEKLRAMFEGFLGCPPIAFVFMGDFLSGQLGASHCSELRLKFKRLGELLVQYPLLTEKCHFIFVPGPGDPAGPKILPRPPLPKFVTEELLKRVPNAIMATNPCRLQYCTQEIVVIREDLVTKMCRNNIHFPSDGEIPDHFARTIISQAHLAPLPLSVCPVYWPMDSALQLYPLPDLIVTADKFNSFSTAHMECQVMNPGSFPRSEFSFKVYVPSSKTVEDSQIPDEED